ncbi:MAG: SDR family NAD(P)-dependent oxidoreductase [Xenococcus sp. MO_188.B8]|nr:SDR family NAD(P)-dependent oxidoreductase [Xenococcus sp. MO_188.B8]
MNDISERINQLSSSKHLLLALDEAVSKLEAVERFKSEPIAIIGMGCRFPGANNLEEFWQLLHDGVDTISEIPPQRWNPDLYYDPDPNTPGKMYIRHAGLLQQVDQFDPEFFGISPREALSIDPQHRLLLEVCWEALENAGVVPRQLVDSQTGVFLGIGQVDYARRQLTSGNHKLISAYDGTGNGLCFASGRLSHVLGLQGPNIAIDTACSSSLVSVHLACQSLRTGECSLALAAGVQLILSPEITIFLSKARALSPDGRCKTFDADADGYGRGEGCGVIALKRMSDAVADGDNILAVIRGSAVNHDGSSSGLTVPNKTAQQTLLRKALANAKVKPSQVSYVEAHGTGTSLGDPVEVGALGTVFGEERVPESPLVIGSVKTNIGHLETAAGIAGLIKVVLSLQHKKIPPHLHFQQPNPHINWNKLPVMVPTDLMPWHSQEGKRIAGVSSFGMSGTNAHVVLEESPLTEPVKTAVVDPPVHLLTLSAKTEEALKQLVHKYENYLATQTNSAIADICFTANIGRSHFEHRLAVIAESTVELREILSAFGSDQADDKLVSGQTNTRKCPQLVFLFTGQGSQYVGMGRQLYETQPVFRQTLERCDEILRPYLEKSLLGVLYPQAEETTPLDETAYTQPALFALEYALFQLWKSWGITPDAVIGHSVGEYVAACVAGVFSLEDGLKLIAQRGALMQTVSTEGEMVVVFADETLVTEAIQGYVEQVAIAAINGPENIVISGERQAVASIVANLEEQGIETKKLVVSHAFHSPLMEPILREFATIAQQIKYSPPKIKLISNLTGKAVNAEITTPEYWTNHLRETVQFNASMKMVHQQGYEIFLEIGPKPTLLGMTHQCLPEAIGVGVPSLRFGCEGWQSMLQSLAQLYVSGITVDWSGFNQDYPRQQVALPTYPFQRQRYWLETAVFDSHSRKSILPSEHPLLGQRLRLPFSSEIRFESKFTPHSPPFLDHHRLYKVVVVPAASHLSMALSAAKEVLGQDSCILEELIFEQALVVPDQKTQTVQLLLTPEEGGELAWQLISLPEEETENQSDSCTLHVQGKMSPLLTNRSSRQSELEAIKTRCQQVLLGSEFYTGLLEAGYHLGSSFQWIETIWQGEGEVLSRMKMPELPDEVKEYQLYPGLLDSCLQLISTCWQEKLDVGEGEFLYVPFCMAKVQFYGSPSDHQYIWCHAQGRLDLSNSQGLGADIRLFDQTGQTIAEFIGFETRKASHETLLPTSQESLKNLLYQVAWYPKEQESKQPPDYLPALQAIRSHLVHQLKKLTARPEIENYGMGLKNLEALSTAYVKEAFQEMDWEYQAGEQFSSKTLADQLGVISSYQRLFDRLLEIMTEEGVLKSIGSQWEVICAPKQTEPLRQMEARLTQYPEVAAELTLLKRCGPKLASVMRGECDPLQLLFPEGDLTMTTMVYQDSPGAKVMNTLVQQAIAFALEKLPQNRKVRVLEIGAGTGGTTAHILPYLNPQQTEYVFTDVSPLFTTQAQDKFRDYPFMRYEILNIEQNPSSQGFEAHQCDVIVAVNVLHATKNLHQTLAHVQQLLSPEGILVLVEGTAPMRWLDLVFGLTEDWWRFADLSLRPSYPLLSASQWQKLLLDSSFAKATTISPAQESQDFLSQQAVIVAQRPAVPFKLKRWLIFADGQGTGQHLADLLKERGDECILVFPGKNYKPLTEGQFQIAPNSPTDFESLLQEVVGKERLLLHGVVHLWSLDAPAVKAMTTEELTAASQLGCGSTLHLVQALGNAEFSESPSLWLVTKGAVSVHTSEEEVVEIAQSSLWGMGKVIALEHPELNCVRVDLDPTSIEAGAQDLLTAIESGSSDDQIAFRNGIRQVAKLEYFSQPSDNETSEGIKLYNDGTYLITGGLGGLGLLVAQWMVERGAKHLVLVGRSNDKAYVRKQIRKLERAGAQVVVAQANVSEQEDVARFLKDMEQSLPPLRGVIHSAGVSEDVVLLQQRWQCFAKVMAPKVEGAWNLHQLTLAQPLDFFILFSSAVTLLGSFGQANYGAANAFLDALAACRRAQGLPGLSINWSAWSDIGATTKYQAGQQVKMKGLGDITPSRGLKVLERLFLQPTTTAQVGVIPINWSQFGKQFTVRGTVPSFFADLVRGTETENKSEEQVSSQQRKFCQKIEKATSIERQKLLVNHVKEQTVKVLRLDPFLNIDLKQPLNEIGFDSLMGIELKNQIENQLEVKISANMLLQGLSIIEIANKLSQELINNKDSFSSAKYQSSIVESTKQPTNDWIVHQKSKSKSKLRLFCFHHAGGNASLFRTWSDALPSTIEVYPIQLPGRRESTNEPMFTQFEALIETLTQLLIPYLDKPFAFYGHSLGGLISFELIHALRQACNLEPIHLFVSGALVPHAISTTLTNKMSSLEELLKVVELPKSIQNDKSFMDEFISVFRKDSQLFKSYTYLDRDPINCSISAFGGTEDSLISKDNLLDWSYYTSETFTLHMFPGKHMFPISSEKELVKTISQILVTD